MEKRILTLVIWALLAVVENLAYGQSFFNQRLSESASYNAIAVQVSGKLALCSHSEKGTIILDIDGGVPPYSFRWNTNETTQNRTNLFAGTYTVEITDAAGFTHVERIVVQPPYPLLLNPVEKQDASCGSGRDGYAKVSVKVGRGEPYRVKWSHGLENTWEADNLAPGTYSVTVTDKYNCDVTTSFEIKAPAGGIQVQESVKPLNCSSASSGSIQLNVTGGKAPYEYSWSHGPSTSSVSNLVAGTYSVVITDGTGCAYQASYTIQPLSEIMVSATATEASCASVADGAISLAVSGGVSPYTVNWSDGQSGLAIQNLTAGTYTATITDSEGCTTQQSVTLAAGTDLQVGIKDRKDASCSTSADGSARVAIDGNYSQVIWSDGITDETLRTNLQPGAYNVKVINAEGCEVVTSFEIQSPPGLTAKIESTLDVDCAIGSVKGVAWVSIQGGVEPYTVTWNESNATNREINFNQATTLQVTVIDANGCSTQVESRVDFPSNTTAEGRLEFNYRKLAISSEPEVQVDEEIIFESEISEEFIAWEWAFGDGTLSAERDPIHIFNQAGTYEVTLTGYDIYGCSSIETNTVQVNNPQEMMVVPNAFTPNGDGLNDTFMPKVKGMQSFSLDLFNTWGERIFSTTAPEDKGWDGTHQGQLAPAGNYLYQITYTTRDGDVFHQTGGVTLIR
ncbi:T9SS type B sorting domain-containing protein [Algoriphagus namhaensis]